jgi:hypothetical protein
MSKIINLFILLFVLSVPHDIWGFSLFKNCINQDQSFHQHIVDPNTLKLYNSEEYSVSIIQCVNITGRYPFSFFDSGTPLHPDDSIKIIEKDKHEVCEGDTLYVYDKECLIITMSNDCKLRK